MTIVELSPDFIHKRICRDVSFAQGVDLAYIQTGISGVFFFFGGGGGGVKFRKSVFLSTGHSCCILLGSQINDVFLSVLCLQRYFLGLILFTR